MHVLVIKITKTIGNTTYSHNLYSIIREIF